MRRWLSSITPCLLLLAAAAAHADASHLVGELAPPVRARPLHSDREIDLADYRGRVVVLAFVATWCSACRQMAPELDALAVRHDDAVAVLALSHEPRARLRRHADARPRRHALLQCTGHTAVAYGVDALPTIVVIDREGRVRAAHQGATPEVVRRLRAEVESLL